MAEQVWAARPPLPHPLQHPFCRPLSGFVIGIGGHRLVDARFDVVDRQAPGLQAGHVESDLPNRRGGWEAEIGGAMSNG